MEQKLDITVTPFDDISDGALVVLDGIIDLHVTKVLEGKFKEIVNDGFSLLAIQLENVKYIDSVGLRILIDVNNLAGSKKGVVALINPSPIVKRVLEITALTRIFKMCMTEEEARKALQNHQNQ